MRTKLARLEVTLVQDLLAATTFNMRRRIATLNDAVSNSVANYYITHDNTLTPTKLSDSRTDYTKLSDARPLAVVYIARLRPALTARYIHCDAKKMSCRIVRQTRYRTVFATRRSPATDSDNR